MSSDENFMTSDFKSVYILGSTGSIGVSTLDVIRQNPIFKVFALSAGKNDTKMLSQCIEFKPKYAVMFDAVKARKLKDALRSHNTSTIVLSGTQAMCDLAQVDEVDIVMSAIVGAAGLLPTLAAVEAGKKVLLANKESLVMSGQLFIDKVKKHNATLLPIDSEHNAIYQCLPAAMQNNAQNTSLIEQGINKILLTGSGGPFLNRDINTFSQVSVDEAVTHPNWNMGRKISVDSATMMNKGLEFIEAKWLFNASVDDIDVVIHPQSIIHSMVQYKDGSVLAQMGNPDMRTPIAHALAYPKRIESGVKALDFTNMANFSFTAPDFSRYPNLKLAMDACRLGQAATTTINAANEIAVGAFLSNNISFTDIYKINSQVLNMMPNNHADSLEDILNIDEIARNYANEIINKEIKDV
ncbi:1-deoxy-D-xylulose-5-phosphate reductoisomerase [Pseudoalteromonas denitrificans]|uniref:1-deoxy-D-xylulose 5-phosphate reductoisomerase n=1 Tax=Pseudoalteromonas denitrificans DSM 6059 TaxID=1123010 RepID=A0A1I1HB80_9GAMM|nr:1-deoxy-D-xylulose-5-phosphate reductoisomerase [Pseudoalteromonas denitrificans]SFC21026.1 1-deoxy-D-xylulose 5-phosphate reductoisomerase [Pseudoalteromonas denitrificans DSM 6059]